MHLSLRGCMAHAAVHSAQARAEGYGSGSEELTPRAGGDVS